MNTPASLLRTLVIAVTAITLGAPSLEAAAQAFPNKPIRLLVEAGVCVICAGGGGIPVVRGKDGNMEGVEAVIDKDRTSALLAQALDADVILMLTDVEAVFRDWGGPDQSAIGSITRGPLAPIRPPRSSQRSEPVGNRTTT